MNLAMFGWFMRRGDRGDHSVGRLGNWACRLGRGLPDLHDGLMAAGVEGTQDQDAFALGQPLVTDTQATDSSSPELSPHSNSFNPNGRRILVVDDNIDAAKSLAKVLTLLHGQNVEVAHDGPSALELAEAFRPQIVLLDISLPGMTGYEVAELLRRRPWFEGCLLVAVTGWGQEKYVATSRAAGFHHHLVKPVNDATIQKLLDGNLRPDDSD